ncbi:hypothetical protein AK812_SmicGene21900 [Symbiodinium microadriaticum]|uniref:Uncharacterized protein n=1 Tax=Symbiodinium microadriaticum TaxID=2951 RepID=A0A1Q9DL62_SYMMI|nr:hypothetical protein AK812_SmicGene21900 [Symbiodinium microadriaticum]
MDKAFLKPHPSSVASFSGKGADWWEGTGNGGQDVEGEGGRSNAWVCFNELSQLEENYSLAGISPARSSALLLLCGEGPLCVRRLGGDPMKDPSAEAEAGSAGASDEAFSRWWAESLGDSEPEKPEEQVAVSLQDLSWVVLRAMLHLLFRLFCSDAKRYAELVKEGEVGSTILSVVEQIIRAESNTDSVPKSMPKTSAGRPKKGKPKEVSGITAQSFYPASYSSAHQPATGRPKARFGGLAKAQSSIRRPGKGFRDRC